MEPSDLLVACKNAMVILDGRRQRIMRGQTIARRGHPIVEGREALFKPLVVHYDLPADGEGKPAQAADVAPPAPPASDGDQPPASTPDTAAETPADPPADTTEEAAVPVTDNSADETASARPGARSDAMAPDTKAIRAWAAKEGLDVPARGPLPPAVVDAYRAAHADQ